MRSFSLFLLSTVNLPNSSRYFLHVVFGQLFLTMIIDTVKNFSISSIFGTNYSLFCDQFKAENFDGLVF